MLKMKPFGISLLLVVFSVGLLPSAFAQRSGEDKRAERNEARAIRNAKRAEKIEKVEKMIQAEEMGTIVYNKQNVYGFKLNNDGWGAYYEKSLMKTVTKANWLNVEFGHRKHLKELRQSGDIFGSVNTYAKQNAFFQAKLGYGRQLLIGGKGNRNGVAISALYGGGLSLGLLKPFYYLATSRQNQNDQVHIVKYTDGVDSLADAMVLSNGYARTNYKMLYGISETSIRPGIYANTGLRFDFGSYNEVVSAIRCGINAEMYASKIPIMAKVPAKRAFLNLYVAVEFGQRK